MQGMLATSLNTMMDSGQLQKLSIVRLDEFICNTVQNRRIVIVLNLTAIQACNQQIGNPVRIDEVWAPGPKQPPSVAAAAAPVAAAPVEWR